MTKNRKNRTFSKYGILFLVFGHILLACDSKKERVLPFIGNYDIVYSEVDGKERQDTIYPRVPDFSFVNEDSVRVRSSDLKGKVWVVDFFFTTCPTICPIMTTQLKRLQHKTIDLQSEIQFISFTINPDYDSPSILKKYRKLHGITANNWVFLNGDEERTHQMGIEGFQIFAGRDDEAEGGYAHSGAFTLVDKEGYVRGVYLGTDPKQVDQLEKDIRKLLKYEYDID